MPIEKEPASNATAEKLLLVMETLSAHTEPVRLIDLANELHMNSSTAYRFVTALVNCGYAVKTKDSDRYTMSLKLCQLADMIRSRYTIFSLLHSFVMEASEAFNESAHLSSRENNSIVYIDNATNSSQMLSIRQYIGKVAPMHCTGVGKLFMLEYSMSELDAYVEEKGLIGYTPNTLTSKEELINELNVIRKNGYAIDNEECELGVRCVAVPIYDYSGKMVAGLSISGPSLRITEERIPEISARMVNIAGRASEVMGYKPVSINRYSFD